MYNKDVYIKMVVIASELCMDLSHNLVPEVGFISQDYKGYYLIKMRINVIVMSSC